MNSFGKPFSVAGSIMKRVWPKLVDKNLIYNVLP